MNSSAHSSRCQTWLNQAARTSKQRRRERFDARSDSETLCLLSPLSKLGLWDNSGAASGGFMHTTLQNPLHLKRREPVWRQNKDFFVFTLFAPVAQTGSQQRGKPELHVIPPDAGEMKQITEVCQMKKIKTVYYICLLSDFGELRESWGRPLPLISCSSLDLGHSLYSQTPLGVYRLSSSSFPKIQYPAGMCSFTPSRKWTCRNWMCSSLSCSEARPCALSAVGLFSFIGDKSTLLRGIT